MVKFNKKTSSSPDIPTSALPDIIFMLLFFFMVTTIIREDDLLVENKVPLAEQLNKIERKPLVGHIYIGSPKETRLYGSEPRIQVNDVLINPEGITNFVATEIGKIPEREKDQITMSMNVDKEAKMGLIHDVQTKLREANARKLMYSSQSDNQEY